MDLQQRKLIKSEWDSIEKPLCKDEVEILNLITKGYDDINIKYNKNNTVLTYLKMESSIQLEDYIFSRWFLDRWVLIEHESLIPEDSPVWERKSTLSIAQYKPNWRITGTTPKKSIEIRLQRYNADKIAQENIMENTLMTLLESMIKNRYGTNNSVCKGSKRVKPNDNWAKQYVTLSKIMQCKLSPNKHVARIVNAFLTHWKDDVDITHVIKNSSEYIEQNKDILAYADMGLYEHQKRIFAHVKNPAPKLIMYTAPTGTGKTLTPLGILGGHKVIFVCAARHVGLALAKSAINIQKKVAFAFGCETADDIRLHYYAAKDYTKDWKTGGIRKVDNSVGDKVELMICDVKSYLPAMYYMLAFNEKEDIVMYWDEPTITLDYNNHECHSIIQTNWAKNTIPNVVLSSATLPKMHELTNTIADFQDKFQHEDTLIVDILSSDCKKSVPIVNKYGYVVSPHNISNNYDSCQSFIAHCKANPVLLRYFDLNDISKAIVLVNKNKYSSRPIERHFVSIDDVTMQEIKNYYIIMMEHLNKSEWNEFYVESYNMREAVVTDSPKNRELRRVQSTGSHNLAHVFTPSTQNAGEPLRRTTSTMGVTGAPSNVVGTYISTHDSHTLTNGPTIYLSDEPEKIAKFCIQQANIPEVVMTDLLQSIEYNNKLNEKIEKMEHDLEDALPKEKDTSDAVKSKSSTTKKTDRILDSGGSIAQLREKLDAHRKLIKTTQLNDTFIPNKPAHLEKWADGKNAENVFTSSIDEQTIVKIMSLSDVSNSWKVLLMLGIGVFTSHSSVDYTEIMKQLADQQRLYLIIASSDYIYGTNYQFCHGYISKNMNLTQEKIIQAIGRVGRNGLQQKYTIRFRDEEPIMKLFTHEEDKPEVVNMNRLFNTPLSI